MLSAPIVVLGIVALFLLIIALVAILEKSVAKKSKSAKKPKASKIPEVEQPKLPLEGNEYPSADKFDPPPADDCPQDAPAELAKDHDPDSPPEVTHVVKLPVPHDHPALEQPPEVAVEPLPFTPELLTPLPLPVRLTHCTLAVWDIPLYGRVVVIVPPANDAGADALIDALKDGQQADVDFHPPGT